MITERQDGLLIVGTEGRALEVESVDYFNSTIDVDLFPFQVPPQDKYISISVGREERSNLTVTLVRKTNHTPEVVFSYSRAQVFKTSICVDKSQKVMQGLFSDGAKLPQ